MRKEKEPIPEDQPIREPENDEASSFITKAANILTSLSNGINNVTDIAKDCGLSTSTVHRILNTLKEPRLTIYDQVNHRYYLGPLVTRLAANPKATHQYLINLAQDEMKRLSNLTEETVTLTLLMGTEFLLLHVIDSKHSLRVEERVQGGRGLLPMGASQLALVAELGDTELKRVIRTTISNESPTQCIDIDLESLLDQVKQVRKTGYAVTHSERIPGVIGVAAPVKNYFCPLSLTVIGPETRLSSRVSKVAEALKESSARLSDLILKLYD